MTLRHRLDRGAQRGEIGDIDDRRLDRVPGSREPRDLALEGGESLSASVTRAPFSAMTSAIARPRPLAAPVTRATRSRTSKQRFGFHVFLPSSSSFSVAMRSCSASAIPCGAPPPAATSAAASIGVPKRRRIG